MSDLELPCTRCGHDAELHALDSRGITPEPYCEVDDCTCPGYAAAARLDEAQPERRNAHEFLESLCQLAEEQLAVQRHLLATLSSSSDSRSSVEVKTSTRGHDISVKAYEGSPTDGLVDQAIAMFGDAFRKVQERSANGWAETVDGLAEAKAAPA